MAARKVAILGTHSPRQCGIATFTHDLAHALKDSRQNSDVIVVAMGNGRSYNYPEQVSLTIDQDDPAAYEAAADALNARQIDVLCVQHEFGIFGGPAGSFLLALLRRVQAPIVTTLHTVLERFTPEQAALMEELVLLSATVAVMSHRAVQQLLAIDVPANKVIVIPHGIPDVTADKAAEKARMGLAGRSLILTYGLLSPNKGIETAIRSLPAIVRHVPDLTYLVLGATHPNVRAQYGEAYREQLVLLADELGVGLNLRFDNTYSDLDGITRALAAADICLIPYINREQIASGTLAYSVGNGKAVVSTPFWHAEELLADGRGALVPFNDPGAMSEMLCHLLLDEPARAAMERKAGAFGVRMRWPNVAACYLAAFDAARAPRPAVSATVRLPALRLDHLTAMADDTGLLQHATIAIPNRSEGYTTDDNARALHLAALSGDDPQALSLAKVTLAFIGHAFQPNTGRFHNFMSYGRDWLDEDGGQNAQARAVRALVAASHELKGGLGQTARELLKRAWPSLTGLTSPRAQAIALCALAERAEHGVIEPAWLTLADDYAANLMHRYSESAGPGWSWFERDLSYSNAKLPHGLIAYGRVFDRPDMLDAGLETLTWLETQQTAPDGSFLPIGSDRVYGMGQARPLWDGQPIEAYATVSAALAAHRATRHAFWIASARRALDWLFGRNLLNISLYDAETGGCRDGLHRDRTNANQGAESTLALWLSVTEYNRVARLEATPRVSGA